MPSLTATFTLPVMSNRVRLVVSGAAHTTGGVSTHVRSLASALVAEGWTTSIESPREFIVAGPRTRRGDVAHFHVSHASGPRLILLILLVTLAGVRGSVITFHHGPSPERYSASRSDQLLLRHLFARVGGIIALTRAFETFVLALTPHANVVLSSSFVAPAALENDRTMRSPVQQVGPVARVNHWVVMSGNETALYRYAGVILALASAKQTDQLQGLRICTYGPRDDAHMATVLAESECHQIPTEWFRDLATGQFNDVLRNSDVYVRNTTGDSFGLAIAEALAAGSRVIATDVCTRPEDVYLVRVHDPAHLADTLHSVLALEAPSHNAVKIAQSDLKKLGKSALTEVLLMYRSLCGPRASQPTPCH